MNRRIMRTYTALEEPEVIVTNLLLDRGIENIQEFLHPQHPTDIDLLDLLKNDQPHEYDGQASMGRAFQILRELHTTQKPIVVYTDYDADGVTGGTIMWETLHKLGFKVIPYVPLRSEGYGFSKEGIDHVIEEHNPGLIVSVDHGIVAHEHIAYAKQRGVPVIVTDHHHMQDGHPPEALAVFHTPLVSGAGVAYFFAKHIVDQMGNVQNHEHLKFMFRNDYLAIAAIGIIADLVPLVGPARSIARAGLASLRTCSRVGLRELLRSAGVDVQKPVTAYHVGFMIAPRINAFGRLEHALDALRLLCTTSLEKATDLSKRAESINSDRQKRVQSAVTDALKSVPPDAKIIILQSDTWEDGIIGLIAGKVLQAHYRPTIVMAVTDGFAKASVRSVDGIHITHFLQDLKEFLVDMGGHAAAGGFTIKTECIEAFTQAARAKAETEFTDELLTPTEMIDIELPLSNATIHCARAFAELGPFGMQFQNPILLSEGIVEDVRVLGKTGSHVKIQLRHESTTCEMISFNSSAEIMNIAYGDKVRVQYTLDINVWNGRESVQGIVKKLEVLHS